MQARPRSTDIAIRSHECLSHRVQFTLVMGLDKPHLPLLSIACRSLPQGIASSVALIECIDARGTLPETATAIGRLI